MGEWLIYGSNGSQKATVKKLEYSGEFMGETFVTCDIYSPSPISFSVGDYLSYRGENFVIDYDATRKKQSRVNTYGKGFVYEGMKFTSYVGELKKCDFLDFVLNDNLQHYSQLPTFDFYAETVEALADRLQANLNRMYTGSKAWSVSVVSGFEGKENVNVQISNIKCFDALKMAYEQFNAQYVIRGRHIYIGTAGSSLETTFRYGIGNGLKTIERSVDESDSLVTRLRAYGNTTNLPANYYKNIDMRVYAPIYEIYHVSTTGCDIHFVPKLKNACFSDKNGQYNYWVSVSLDETLWLRAVASPNNHLSSTAYSVVTVGLYDGNTQAMVTQFNTQLQSGTYNKLYFKQGINVGAWPVEYREYAENVPDLMSIDRLMLPGFPELTTDPYIDSSNIATLGVREKSVYFDGTDTDTPDIHPTLDGMTATELRAAGYVIDLDAGDNGNLDEIAADATETDGSPITADGAFEGVDEVPGFKVSIKDIGFDINDYLSTETATLVMKTGMCGGREFTIVKVEKVGNKYVLECQRTEDVSHYFPYNPYLIKAGDKFVLTNIEMPKAYIDAASQRLLAAAQAYIAKYSEPQWVYAIKMDDIWMQRQRDNSVSEASSYYWNIKEGDVMNVTDADLGVDISEVIDRLTIREGYGPIPEFEVVLRKEKPQSTLGILQNKVRKTERQNQEQSNTIIRQQNYIKYVFDGKIDDVQKQVEDTREFAENIKTLEGNLILNSGFTGEYESEPVSEDLEISSDTEMFSDPLRHWDYSSVTVADNANMVTGKAAEITNGTLKQTIGFLNNGSYMLSFKAQVTSLTIDFLGLSAVAVPSSNVERYDFQFILEEVTYGSLEFSGTATISEIMLTQGTLKREWKPSVLDNDMAHADIVALDYLSNAITKASTTINGGLVLTQMIKVGNYRCDESGKYTMYEETGGMSGRVNNTKSPFLWGGGSLKQALFTIEKYAKNPAYQATQDEISQMAQFVVTHGGRAILNDIILRGYIYAEGGIFKNVQSPNGNWKIDENGNVETHGKIIADEGEIGSLKIDSSGIGEIQTVLAVNPLKSTRLEHGRLFLNYKRLFNNDSQSAEFDVDGTDSYYVYIKASSGASDLELQYIAALRVEASNGNTQALDISGDSRFDGNVKINGTLKTAGLSVNTREISDDYTVLETDDVILFNGSSNITITLPQITNGKVIKVYVDSLSNVTISGTLRKDGNNLSSITLSSVGDYYTFISFGSYWVCVKDNG